jgi:hypothetical protein
MVRRAAGGKTWEVDLAIPVFNRDRNYLDALLPGVITRVVADRAITAQ